MIFMVKNKNNLPPLVRVALYIRVSGEEQKIKGLSLEAQQERLEAYAREKGWLIVGIYIDAAKTARKNMHKRAEFQKMIESVKRDEVDLLLFCRLDRWFRHDFQPLFFADLVPERAGARNDSSVGNLAVKYNVYPFPAYVVAYKGSELYYYRCNQHFQRGRCSHKVEAREDFIEKWLFDNLESELNRVRLEWEVKAAEKKKSALRTDKATLKRKLTKLKVRTAYAEKLQYTNLRRKFPGYISLYPVG